MRRLALPLLLAAAAAIASEKQSEKRPAKPHDTKARTLFLARCSACHDPGRVSHRRASRDGWREIVFRMQRMPQSGISKADAAKIIDYLASIGRRAARPGAVLGGRGSYGKEWLAILETAFVEDRHVTLGGRKYRASVEGLTVFLRRGKKTRTLALTDKGKPAATSIVDEWRIGSTRYEIHLVLYQAGRGRTRLARALKRLP